MRDKKGQGAGMSGALASPLMPRSRGTEISARGVIGAAGSEAEAMDAARATIDEIKSNSRSGSPGVIRQFLAHAGPVRHCRPNTAELRADKLGDPLWQITACTASTIPAGRIAPVTKIVSQCAISLLLRK